MIHKVTVFKQTSPLTKRYSCKCYVSNTNINCKRGNRNPLQVRIVEALAPSNNSEKKPKLYKSPFSRVT